MLQPLRADLAPTARRSLLPLGIAFGLAAEWVSYETDEPELALGDFAVGVILIGCGVVAWERRPQSRVGGLMTLAGFGWFLGTFVGPALYVHRGPLVHLLFSYPTGRSGTRFSRGVVLVAYVVAAIEPLGRDEAVTIALAGLVALGAIRAFVTSSGTVRKARGAALVAALAFAAVLAVGAVARVAGWDAQSGVLWTYEIVIAAAALALLVDLLRGRWGDAVLTGLVVDLGPPAEAGTLRAKLARALGDPSLVVGYRLRDSGTFVDDRGQPVELPPAGSGRVVTPIEDRGEQVAVLVHDDAVLADRPLVESVAAAARIAVANARLQAEAHARAVELEASRRRIVEAADAQRRRLERELRLGAERRLGHVAASLADARAQAAGQADALVPLQAELVDARRELREFAHGVHPAALTDGGLMAALALLATRSAVPVEVTGEVGRLAGPVEAALYFVCSEALANATKHSGASRISIAIADEPGRVVVTVADDGSGGARLDAGFGLRSLSDRVEAFGGAFSVESPRGEGTRIVAEIPSAG